MASTTLTSGAPSNTAFKYAEASEIASASLRHGCLQPQAASSLQTLPHHYANFANLSSSSRNRPYFEAPSFESAASSRIPDIIQQTASDSEDNNEAGGGHVIVNQLLTFLTEKQQQQLIDLSSEANTASTTSTLRLTEP